MAKSIILCGLFLFASPLYAHTADWVAYKTDPNGKITIEIRYTNLQNLRYRRALVNYFNHEQAEQDFNKLVKGIDFYFGPMGSLQFASQDTQLRPRQPW